MLARINGVFLSNLLLTLSRDDCSRLDTFTTCEVESDETAELRRISVQSRAA